MVPFDFGGQQIRVVMQDGAPWFVAKDVCQALGLKGYASNLIHSVDQEDRLVVTRKSHANNTRLVSAVLEGKAPSATLINDSGMYTLALRCDGALKPGTAPYRFRRWVTSEVLPSIRKNGGYIAGQEKTNRNKLTQTD